MGDDLDLLDSGMGLYNFSSSLFGGGSSTPTFDLGSGAANSTASFAYPGLSALGLGSNQAGSASAGLGIFAGMSQTPSFQQAYANAATPAPAASNPTGSGSSNSTTPSAGSSGSSWMSCLFSDTSTCLSAATGGSSGSHWYSNLSVGGVAAAFVGLILVIGALYLFGSSSVSDAIGNAVQSIKGK